MGLGGADLDVQSFGNLGIRAAVREQEQHLAFAAVMVALTVALVTGGVVGARPAPRVNASTLSAAFTVLVLGVAVCTTACVISPIV